MVNVNKTTFLIGLFLCFPIIREAFTWVPQLSGIATIIALLIIYIPFELLFLTNPKIVKLDALILIALVAMIFIITILIFPEYKSVYFDENNSIFQKVFTFRSGVFAYLFFRMEENPKRILSMLKKVSIILFFYHSLRIKDVLDDGLWEITLFDGSIAHMRYNMSFGYDMIFWVIILFYFFLTEKKILFGLLSLAGLIQVFLWGSRGALVSFLLFVIFYLTFGDRKLFTVKKALLITLLSMIFLSLLNNNILIKLQSFINSLGINSRTLDSIISGEITNDNGREFIQNTVLAFINNSPLVGYGAYSDRYWVGHYSHNIFLELLMTFGIPLGGMLIILFLIMVTFMLIKCKNIHWKSLFIIFLSISMGRLFFSSSFWQESSFWIMLAIFVSYIKSIKRRVNYD